MMERDEPEVPARPNRVLEFTTRGRSTPQSWTFGTTAAGRGQDFSSLRKAIGVELLSLLAESR